MTSGMTQKNSYRICLVIYPTHPLWFHKKSTVTLKKADERPTALHQARQTHDGSRDRQQAANRLPFRNAQGQIASALLGTIRSGTRRITSGSAISPSRLVTGRRSSRFTAIPGGPVAPPPGASTGEATPAHAGGLDRAAKAGIRPIRMKESAARAWAGLQANHSQCWRPMATRGPEREEKS